MSAHATAVADVFRDYLLANGVSEPEILARLRRETAAMPMAIMQISPEQGCFMALLTELLGVRRYLEIGTFTGYSSLAVALAMPPGGRITALDVSEEWTAVARRYWREAGVEDRIDLRLAPALDSLDALLAEGQAGRYDFAFIDADKTGYPAYYERSLALLRPGGVIAVDNAFHMGAVVDPAKVVRGDTAVIHDLNRRIAADPRVSHCLLPVGDGLHLARKR